MCQEITDIAEVLEEHVLVPQVVQVDGPARAVNSVDIKYKADSQPLNFVCDYRSTGFYCELTDYPG